jgi:hypothetical protein
MFKFGGQAQSAAQDDQGLRLEGTVSY